MDNKEELNDYFFYKSIGICPKCKKNHLAIGFSACPECLEKGAIYRYNLPEEKLKEIYKKQVEYNKNKARERRAKGLCRRCNKTAVEDKTLCQYHLNKQREESRRKRAKNGAEARGIKTKRRIKSGLCSKCDNKAVDGYKLCQKHLDIQRKAVKKFNEEHPEFLKERKKKLKIRKGV